MKNDFNMLNDLWAEIIAKFAVYEGEFGNLEAWFDRRNGTRYTLEIGSCNTKTGNSKIECDFFQRAGTVLAKPEKDQPSSIENFADEIDNI